MAGLLSEKDAPGGGGEGAAEGGEAGGVPLAERLRPKGLEEVIGQEHLWGAKGGEQGPLGRMLAKGRVASLVLWGPPGSGKTSIARLLAEKVGLEFRQISAIFSGVADLKKLFAQAELMRRHGQGMLLFVDEIHRFNRAQQDGFLPVVERGDVILVGATTENPSFELNAALLSRLQVLRLRRLDAAALEVLLARAEAHVGARLPLTEEGRAAAREMCDGDGRFLLNLAEEIFAAPPAADMDRAAVGAFAQRRLAVYDKDREEHYNLISALHKAVRGSDADAALYWLARMLRGGEDPLFLARRLIRMAVEDIGLADPQALVVCEAAKEAYRFLGTPEGELALAQSVIYLALAPKSNAAYRAFSGAWRDAEKHGSLPPPMHILNAPTRAMKEWGYGAGYRYDHDEEAGFSGQAYFPEGMGERRYYRPVARGFEREMIKRLEYWRRLRAERGGGSSRAEGDSSVAARDEEVLPARGASASRGEGKKT